MTQLLISVRSAAEAEIALTGGADVIDAKEPDKGSLGRCDAATLLAIAEVIGNRATFSAAMGELTVVPIPPPAGLRGYVKVGLSGMTTHPHWQEEWCRWSQSLAPGQTPVLVAYVDALEVGAPPLAEVLAVGADQNVVTLLLDTWKKDGRSLLDHLSLDQVREIVKAWQERGGRIALAGALHLDLVSRLLPLMPDFIAVRAAACKQGQRGRELDLTAVRKLADVVHETSRKFNRRTAGNRGASVGK